MIDLARKGRILYDVAGAKPGTGYSPEERAYRAEVERWYLEQRAKNPSFIIELPAGMEVAGETRFDGEPRADRIEERGGRWYVYSEDGSKRLGGPYATEAEAVARLRQVEGHKAG